MWNKLSQAAGLSSPESEEAPEKIFPDVELQEQIEQQNLVIEQLKDLLRENEKRCAEKEKELEDVSAKFQKFKLQSKAKVAHLVNQLKNQEKTAKKDEADFDDASSSDSTEQSTRGKVILLKKQLEQAKQQIEKKEKEIQDITKNFELRISDLQAQSCSQSFVTVSEVPEDTTDAPKSPSKESNVQEMYAQIVYKDSKIMELNNQILEQERKILDLQEHIKEKDEVLQSRNRAVQLMTEDMNRKGRTVADELGETREQMKLMQENFAEVEMKWKQKIDSLKKEMQDKQEKDQNELSEKDSKIKGIEENLKKLEASRYELVTKNAELQKKIVLVQEKADKQCEAYKKEIEEELQGLTHDLQSEKARSAELQKVLNETASQSESKVLKARVKERTKLKALERELAAVKQLQSDKQKPEDVTQLQQRIAVLEEEKGTLQLKLMEVDEQISVQEKLKDEISALQDSLVEAQGKIEHFEKYICQLEAEKTDVQHRYDELTVLNEQLQANFNERCEMISSLKETVKQLNIVERVDEANVLNENIVQLTQEQNMSEKLNALKDEKVALEMKIIELEELREGDQKAKKDLENKLKILEDSINSDSSSVSHLQQEKRELEDRYHKLTETKIALENQVMELTQQLNFVRKELLDEQNKCLALSDQISILSTENKSVIDKLNVIQENYDNLQAIIEHTNSQVQEREEEWKLIRENSDIIQNQLNTVFSITSVSNVQELQEKWNSHQDYLEELKCKIESEMNEKQELLLKLTENDQKLHEYEQKCQEIYSTLEEQQKNFRIEKEKLSQMIKEKIDENSELQDLILKNSEKINQYEYIIKTKENELRVLNQEIKEKSEHLQVLQKENNHKSEELDNLIKLHASDKNKVDSKIASLLEQISDLETELARLQNDFEIKEKEADFLKSELSNLQFEYKKAIDVCSHKELCIQSICKEKDDVCEQLTSTRQDLLQKESKFELTSKEMTSKCSALENTVKDCQNHITSLEESLKEKEVEIRSLNEILPKKEIEVQELTETVSILKEELNSKNAQLNEFFQRCENLEKSNTVLQNELQSTKQEISSLETEIAYSKSSVSEKEEMYKSNLIEKQQLENEAIEMKAELEKLKANLSELTVKVEEFKVANATLKQNFENVNMQLENSKQCLEHSAVEMQSLQECIDNLTVDVKDKQKIIEDLTSCFNVKEEEVKAHDKKTSALLDCLNASKTTIEELEQSINAKSLKLEELNKTESNYQIQLKNLTVDKSNLENTVKLLKEERISLENEFKNQIETLNKQINDLFSDNKKLKEEIKSSSENHFSQIVNLTSELECVNQSLLSSKNEIDSYLVKCKILSDECEHLKHDNFEYKQKESELKEIITNYESKIKILEENCDFNKGVREKLEQSQNEKSVLEETCKSLNQQLEAIKVLNHQLINENDTLKNSVFEVEDKLNNLKRTISENEKAETDMLLQIKNYEQKLEYARTSCENLALFKEQYCILAKKIKQFNESEKSKDEFTLENLNLENATYYFKEIDSDLENLQHKLKNFEQTINALQQETENVKKDIEYMHEDNVATKKNFAVLEETKKSLELENFNIKLSLENLGNDFAKVIEIYDAKSKNLLSILNLKAEKLKQMLCMFLVIRNEISTYKKKVVLLQDKEKEFCSEVESKTKLLQDLQMQNKELSEKLTKSDDDCKLLHVQLKQSKEHIDILESSSTEHVQKVSSELKSSHLQMQELQKDLSDAKNENQLLKQQLLEVEKQAFLFQEKLNELNSINKGLKTEIESKINELTLKSEEIDFCKNTIHNLNSDFQAAVEKIKLLQEEKFSNEQNYNSCKKELNDYINVIKEKENVLVKVLSEKEQSDNKVVSLQQELENVKSFLISLKAENEQLHLTVKSLQEEVVNCNSVIETFEIENSTVKKDLLDATSQLQQADNDRNSLQNNVSSLQAELSKVSKENIELMNEIKHKCNILKSVNITENEELARQLECVTSELKKCRSDKDELTSQLHEYEIINKNISSLSEQYDAAKKFLEELISFLTNSDNLSSFDESSLLISSSDDEYFQKLISKLKQQVLDKIKYRKQIKYDTRRNSRGLEIKEEEESTSSDVIKQISMEENEKLLLEIATLKEKLQSTEKLLQEANSSVSGQTSVLSPVVDSRKFETEVLHQKGSPDETDVINIDEMKSENYSLKQQLAMNKMKSDKMLIKLKLFKDKFEKTQNEVKELNDVKEKLSLVLTENQDLRHNLSVQIDTLSNLRNDVHRLERNKNQEIDKLKEHTSQLNSHCVKLKSELEECRHHWHELNVSHELLKEDSNLLRSTLSKLQDQLEVLKQEHLSLQDRYSEIEVERNHLLKEAHNLKEQMDMLISDNDSFQSIIDKLRHTKQTLEENLKEERDKFSKEMKNAENLYQQQLEKLKHAEENVEKYKKIILSLENKCHEFELKNKSLQETVERYLHDKKKLEDEYVQLKQDFAQMHEKLQLQNANSAITSIHAANLSLGKDKAVQADHVQDNNAKDVSEFDFDIQQKSHSQMYHELLTNHNALTKALQCEIKNISTDNQYLQAEVESLHKELYLSQQSCIKQAEKHAQEYRRWQEEKVKLESAYRKQISELQAVVTCDKQAYNIAEINPVSDKLHEVNKELEQELQLTIKSLHQKDLRCEELSMDVSKLLEERNSLKLKLNNYKYQLQMLQAEQSAAKQAHSVLVKTASPADSLHSVKVDIPEEAKELNFAKEPDPSISSQKEELEELHQQLIEFRKTCDELRRANDALDSALTSEKKQRKQIEEELGYVKEHYTQSSKPKDEYHLLLDDFQEPEMVVETNYSISRKVKSHARQLRHWLKGRRNYLYRICQRRNYSELLYLFYICAIHLLLLLCIFRHS